MKRLIALSLLSLPAFAACSSASSLGLTPIPGGFEESSRAANALQLRLSAEGIDALAKNTPLFLEQLSPGGISFPIPASCNGELQVCCKNPDPECAADLALHDTTLGVKAPSSITFEVRASASTRTKHGKQLPVRATVLGLGVDCQVTLDTSKGKTQDIGLKGQLVFSIDPQSQLVRMAVKGAELVDLDDADLVLSGGTVCAIGNLLKPFFIDTILNQFTASIQTLVSEQLCARCAGKASLNEECGEHATACEKGVCLQGAQCLQKLGLEGRMDPARGPFPGAGLLRGAVDLSALVGGYAAAENGGLDLGMMGGALPAANSDSGCVPSRELPAWPPIPRSAFFTGEVPVTVSHHVVLGVHRSFLERVLFSVWQSGGLCLELGGSGPNGLTTETLALLLPSLAEVIGATPAPIAVSLRPGQFPRVELGENSFEETADGERKMREPLLTIFLDDLEIKLDALVDDRYVRVLTMRGDVALPLGLESDGGGALFPVLGDLGAAVQNVEMEPSRLVAEDSKALAESFDTVLAIFAPQLASAMGAMELPKPFGLKLVVPEDGLSAVEDFEFLKIVARLRPAETQLEPVETEALVVALATDLRLRTTARDEDGALLPASAIEWQYRVDGGFWSPFQRAPETRIASPALRWPGLHTVETRARRIGTDASLDETPTRTEIRIEQATPVAKTLGSETLPFDANGCSCSQPAQPGNSPHALVWIAGLLLIAIWRWLKRSETALALAIWALIAAKLFGCAPGAQNNDRDTEDSGLPGSDTDLASDTANEPGAQGRYSDLAVTGETLLISGYESAFGDLLVGRATDDGQISWQFADGVPDERPLFSPETYRKGVRTAGDDVGRYTSLAISGSGAAIVAYHDATHRSLRFAAASDAKNTGFTAHTVDAPTTADKAGIARVGLFASLAQDAENKPLIAYLVTALAADDKGFASELRLARGRTTGPASASDWDIEIVDSAPIPCAGLCGESEFCAALADNDGKLTGQSRCRKRGSCDVLCAAGNGCVVENGTSYCAPLVSAPAAAELPAGVGLWPSLIVRRGGNLALAYYVQTSGDLRLAEKSASGWAIRALAEQGDVGAFPSLVEDASGALHVAYQDATNARLLYQSGASLPQGTFEVIDDGKRGERRSTVGADARLLAEGGAVRAVYQDQDALRLVLGTRGAGGAWTREELGNAAQAGGFYARIARGASGRVWISHFVYDHAIAAGGRLELFSR